MAKPKTVVCIEDDIELQDLVEIILRDPDVETVGVFDGRHGLETVRARKPDLVLLDLLIPDISGWEVYRRIREDEGLRDTPVVVMSACPQRVAAAMSGDLPGLQGYICKPFSAVELRETVDRALGLA